MILGRMSQVDQRRTTIEPTVRVALADNWLRHVCAKRRRDDRLIRVRPNYGDFSPVSIDASGVRQLWNPVAIDSRGVIDRH